MGTEITLSELNRAAEISLKSKNGVNKLYVSTIL
jgi:hypothetical protein